MSSRWDASSSLSTPASEPVPSRRSTKKKVRFGRHSDPPMTKSQKIASKTPTRAPQSIFELVVSTIAARQYEDPLLRQALLACNLASRAFHAAASKYLFHQVRLKEDLIFRPGLRHAFAARPDVFFEIRSLIITIEDKRRSWLSRTSQSVRGGVKEAISQVVSSLPNRPFTVQDLVSDGKLDTFLFRSEALVSWDVLPSAARLAIMTAWQRQTPRRFAVVGITNSEKFYLAPRKSQQSLQELTIHNMEFKPSGSAKKANEARLPTLEVLTGPRTLRIAGTRIADFLEGEQIRLKPPSAVVKNCRVKRLSICLNHERHAFELLSVLYVFRLVSKSLQSLTIEGIDPPPPGVADFPLPLSLDELDNLNSIRIITWEPATRLTHRLSSITRLLNTRTRPGIRNIRLVLNWPVRDREEGNDMLRAQQNSWSQLDKVLLKLMHGTVRLIDIQVVFSFTKPRVSKERATNGWLQEVEFYFQRSLKGVFEAGIPADIHLTASALSTAATPSPSLSLSSSSSPS